MEPTAPEPDVPDAGPGTCMSCGAALAPGQDWCLECGTGSPSRIGRLPGLSTALKVGALTLVLVVFAVGASYAALNHGSKTMLIASTPTPAPAPAPAPATATTAAPTTPTTTSAPSAPVSPPVESTPTVTPDEFPTDTTATPVDTVPVTPIETPTTSTPTPTTPKPRTTTPTPSTPPPTSKPITLTKNAVVLYDPQSRTTSHTDPALAIDGDPSTLFTVNTAPGPGGVQTGFTIDLGHARKVTRIKLDTPTPGFSVLVYGAVDAKLPDTLNEPGSTATDPDWHHLRNANDIGSADGTAEIRLGPHGTGVSGYRYLLLWYTTPPPSSPATRDVPTDTTAATTTAPITTATTSTATTAPPATTTTPPPTTPTQPLGATVSIAELSVFG